MKFRLRVLVAVAATAVLGVTGAVAAAVPASAAPANNSVNICTKSSNGGCLNDGRSPVGIGELPPTNFASPFGMCTTYQGESYCEVRQLGTETCLEWSDTTDNYVNPASCDRNNDTQLWWWDGLKFRNLAAYKAGEDQCMNDKTSNNTVDVYVCSGTTAEWSLF